MKKFLINLLVSLCCFMLLFTGTTLGQLNSENLNRGVAVLPAEDGIFISWRLLVNDPADIAFDLYRNSEKINEAPLTVTNFRDTEADPGIDNSYLVRPITKLKS